MAEHEQDTAPLTITVVGVARGNPGLAGAGIVIMPRDGTADRIAKYLGTATALDAQLQALLLALRYARPHAPHPLTLILGNETAVRQISGEQPARHPSIIRVLPDLANLLAPFPDVTYRYGHGDELAEAERLADIGIDTRLRPLPAYDRPLPT